jgi:prevent-host-death family protein
MSRRPSHRTTFSSREFNQDTGRAKHAARRGPVIITDRGRPSHVLLTFEDYSRLTGGGASIIELLGAPAGVEGADLESPLLRDPVRPADLS